MPSKDRLLPGLEREFAVRGRLVGAGNFVSVRACTACMPLFAQASSETLRELKRIVRGCKAFFRRYRLLHRKAAQRFVIVRELRHAARGGNVPPALVWSCT